MKKITLLGIIFSMLVLSCALSVIAANADFSFEVPSVVVYDVPFSVQLLVNTQGVNFIDYDLSVGTDNSRASFADGVTRADNFQYVGSLSGVQPGGTFYRVRTETNGNTFSTSAASSLLTFTNVKIAQLQENDHATFSLLTSPQRTITPQTSGQSFDINSVDSITLIPSLSQCNDGVVGYIESATPDGIKQENEPVEACDDGNSNGNGGCAADCSYIDLGYSCTNTHLGDRNSVCTPMLKKDLFLAKMNALFNNQCYPTSTHPSRIYEWFCDDRTDNDQPPASRLISSVGAALSLYLASP